MKKIILAMAVVGSMTGVSMVAMSAPALADGFSFSFDSGNVGLAFSDGYYDNNRQWHKWRNKREAREYRTRYKHNYNNRRHRDSDHDGIPNRVDRDRDGDGVPNRFDDSPNNPRRN